MIKKVTDRLGDEQTESEGVDGDDQEEEENEEEDDELEQAQDEDDLPMCPILQKRSKIPEPATVPSKDAKDNGQVTSEVAPNETVDKDIALLDFKLAVLVSTPL
jgi:hypothetical protein